MYELFEGSGRLGLQVTLIPVTNLTAFQVHAVAHSSELPNTHNTIKAGIQRMIGGDIGHETIRFTLPPLREFWATPIAHCSCLAGQ